MAQRNAGETKTEIGLLFHIQVREMNAVPQSHRTRVVARPAAAVVGAAACTVGAAVRRALMGNEEVGCAARGQRATERAAPKGDGFQ